jgi:hypothetical protein
MNDLHELRRKIEPLTFEAIAEGKAMREANLALLEIQNDVVDLSKKAKFTRELTVKIRVVVDEVRGIEEIEFHVLKKLAPYVPQSCRNYFDDEYEESLPPGPRKIR